jgi:hypothetical protein
MNEQYQDFENYPTKRYYIPDISDLFVGYELEKRVAEGFDFEPVKFENLIVIIQGNSTLSVGQQVDTLIKGGNIRTPYLTKEQIEKEGWNFYDIYRDGGTSVFHKGSYMLEFYATNRMSGNTKIIIHRRRGIIEAPNTFCGDCPSINEFRKICKLLGI